MNRGIDPEGRGLPDTLGKRPKIGMAGFCFGMVNEVFGECAAEVLVGGEGHDRGPAEGPATGIADMADNEVITVHRAEGKRAADPDFGADLSSEFGDHLASFFDRNGDREDGAPRPRFKMRAERINGGLRGTGAMGETADTIGHGEESGFGVAEKAVLIGATHSTNLSNGGGSDRERHGRRATDEWGPGGESCLTAV